MIAKQSIAHIVELDGEMIHLDGDNLVPIEDLRDVSGDKWLVTDFQEGMSRVMIVEGPEKYAELLVRRKLQESGEFEEPVTIFTHWKKKRAKTTTDILFTAVPSRLTNYYLVETGQQEDITLVFAMYGVLWNMVSRNASKAPVAVVLRHQRLAEVVVGSKDQVYFANRCVAFDTEKEQIDALWEMVRSDIEAVENEQRTTVGKIIHINWLDAEESPNWPEQWHRRLVVADRGSMQLDQMYKSVSWPLVIKDQTAIQSVSSFKEKLFHYTKSWAPVINMGMLLLVVALLFGFITYRAEARGLQQRVESVQKQIGKVQMRMPQEVLGDDFDRLLKFVEQLDRNRSAPSYQQIVDDLTQTALKQLALNHLKVDYGSGQVRLELSGEIDAPFEHAHGGYQNFLNQMTARGYRVEDSRFETRINKSQVVLKLSRPVI
jgi:hypothetical protein